MKRQISGIILGAALLCGLPTPSLAQDSSVRKEIDAAYEKIIAAYKKRDWTVVGGLTTDAFTWKQPNGVILSRDTALGRLKSQFLVMTAVHGVSFNIKSFSLKDGAVTTETTSGLIGETVDQVGKKHSAVTSNSAKHVWVKAGGAWKLKRIESHSVNLTLDGKPVQVGEMPKNPKLKRPLKEAPAAGITGN